MLVDEDFLSWGSEIGLENKPQSKYKAGLKYTSVKS